ncbi:MAG TPA: IgGFc-binding protein, partial [Saprospiraceae bacterium]|nr:IgGFc-binding protein [Saprospiraceae bacterium]
MKHVVITLLSVLCLHSVAQSQSISSDSLLKFIKTNAGGTEFWFSFPPCYEEVAGAENTTRVFVASSVRQPVTVEVPGKGFTMTKMAVANDVIEFKLPSAVGQAYSKPTQGKAPPEKVYGKCGVHVTSDEPVAVYAMTRFQYTSDGFLVIPISGLGQDYVIASWPQYTAAGSAFKLPGLSNIVAAYDSTEVTFTMGGVSGSRTTGGMTAGQTRKWILNVGDVLCFANDDDGQDIAGSRVTATKPVGVISGNQCANVPAGVPWCDFIAEMEL